MAHTDQTQDRGDLSSYDRYLRGMNTSMRQKVALTAAHLLGQGKVADMGMGSGLGSQALASLYPNLEVVGVDLDPTMVALAKERYPLPNLEFIVGDIAKPVFEPESLDGIFDSSVLHHVTSYVGYRYSNAGDALAAQAVQLKVGGVLVVRDFLAPGTEEVLLDLPGNDGDESGDPTRCSTSSLFERFAGEFRSLSEAPGFAYQALGGTPGREGWKRYQLSLHHAAEFILRKDYRTDWVAEVKEEYGYFTQAEFEGHLASLGLRMLASTPLRNPWIIRNRWEGKCALHSLAGEPLAFPATNYLTVGERVAPGEGVRFHLVGEAEPLGFLKMEQHRHRPTGEVFDLVRRPFPTLDVVPFFEHQGDLYVLARMSYPRPIVGCLAHGSPTLDGRTPSGYVTEPLTIIQTDQPMGTTVETMLHERAGLRSDQLKSFREGAAYYPSPGGIQEEVRSVLVETEATFLQDHLAHRSGFSTAGRVRAIEARQLLRAAQVGGLSDSRLELNVYELLTQRRESFGDWIGEELSLKEIADPPEATDLETLFKRSNRRAFESCRSSESPGYLRIHTSVFEEQDSAGLPVAMKALEYVAPAKTSTNTVVVALIFQHEGQVYLGIEDRDLPAPQSFTGHSNLFTAPAWRIPESVPTLTQAKAWVIDRLKGEHSVTIGEVWELGGPFHPTPGLTPESVHPVVVEVRGHESTPDGLHWVRLSDLLHNRAMLRDGQLRTVAYRLAHALGAGWV
jgi:SAM-dependent methyltransferase